MSHDGRPPSAPPMTDLRASYEFWTASGLGASALRAILHEHRAHVVVCVAIWIHTEPARIASRAPSGPLIVSSTAAPSASIVSTTSAFFAASAGEGARRAPSSTRGAALAAVRFQTDTGKPAASRLRAIGAPMLPVPSTATVVALELCGELVISSLL